MTSLSGRLYIVLCIFLLLLFRVHCQSFNDGAICRIYSIITCPLFSQSLKGATFQYPGGGRSFF